MSRANASKIVRKLWKERVVESSLEAFAFKAEFGRMTFEEIKSKMALNGEVFSAICRSSGN